MFNVKLTENKCFMEMNLLNLKILIKSGINIEEKNAFKYGDISIIDCFNLLLFTI